MAATGASLPQLLNTLKESLILATASFPAEIDRLHVRGDGISLLDTKNDLLLSYLQNLVFLILLKLWDRSHGSEPQSEDGKRGDEAVEKLIEARLHLERGVRPLEARLRYQVERVLKAAEDADRATPHKGTQNGESRKRPERSRKDGSDGSESESDPAGSDGSEGSNHSTQAKIDDLSYRPNLSAFIRNPQPSTSTNPNPSSNTGTYKPPRIAPTSMPSLPTTTTSQEKQPATTRQTKSHLIDEYIDAELSTAPATQPSIGSNHTILGRGRAVLSTRERERERERTDYEEMNLMRLPKEGKAARKKQLSTGGMGGRDVYGGEDWKGLGEVGDRVARSIGKRKGGGGGDGGGEGVLERRKRRLEGQGARGDGRGDGLAMGEAFEKRKRFVEERGEKKRKRR